MQHHSGAEMETRCLLHKVKGFQAPRRDRSLLQCYVVSLPGTYSSSLQSDICERILNVRMLDDALPPMC